MSKNDEKTDLRILRTKRAIRDAFFKLVEEKGFDHITVKDITDEAMISRNTFYLHYSDKFDLLNKICGKMMRKAFLAVAKEVKTQELSFNVECAVRIVLTVQRVIDEDKEIYRLLLTDPGTVVFGDQIEQTTRYALDLIKHEIDGVSDLSIEYIVTGMKGLIRYWVTHSDEEFDVEQECYNFVRIHWGTIISIINKNKEIKHRKQRLDMQGKNQ